MFSAYNAMNHHRYILFNNHGRSKRTCPSCHRPKCFTPYIDQQDEISFPEDVGRCDHESKCGYHCSPKEYFAKNPNIKSKQPMRVVPMETQLQLPTLYIPQDLMLATLRCYELNPLFVFVSGIIGARECLQLFKRYNVGTSKKMAGSTVFWQVDCQGRVRTGKVMLYGNDGHRVKENGVAKLTWVHKIDKEIRKQTGFQMRQCFFGEHLLGRHPNKTIILVESEKSALIASHFFPNYIWLATGGCNGCLNITASEALRGRDVKLLPDLDKTDKWLMKTDMLKSICRSVEVLTWLTDRATEEQRQDGLDVADFLLNAVSQSVTDHPQELTNLQVAELFMKRHPGLRDIIQNLSLECVSPHAINKPNTVYESAENSKI